MNDLRHALRQLRRSPGFALAALLTLTVGIGAAATIFSLVNGILLRPPPGEHPEELVRVYTSHHEGFQYGSLSYPDYRDLRETEEALRDLALFRPVPAAVGEGRSAERGWGQLVTSNFFSLLGIRPALGRGFVSGEDEAGAGTVLVLSHDFWVRRFQRDPDIVGRSVLVNGQAFTVVGVAPEGFRGVQLGLDADFFAPMGAAETLRPGVEVREQRGSRSFLATGRLAPGVTARQASELLSLRMDRLAELYPGTNAGRAVLAIPESEVGMNPEMRGTTVAAAVLFLAAGGLLLLLVTVNVSTLLLARARARRKETGVRIALGATAGRLFRESATESLLLAVGAGGLALAVTSRVSAALARFQPPLEIPLLLEFPVDARVVGATAALTAVIALVVGAVPVFRTSRAEVMSSIRGAGNGAGRKGERAGRGLVVVQLALSLALLVGAGAFVRAAWESSREPLAFETDRHLLATLDPGLYGIDEEEGAALYRSLLDRVRVLPEVRAASLGEMLPVGLTGQQWGVSVEGYTPAPDEDMIVDYNVVGPGYFGALGVTVLEGRDFGEADDANGEPVAIVNEVMARRYWPDGDALGGVVHVAGDMRRVVGVVPALHLPTLDPEPGPYVWVPHRQFYNSAMVLHVRTAGPPEPAVAALRSALEDAAPGLPILDVQTMEEHVALGLLPLRAGTAIFALLGGIGLFLAVVGLYGVLSFHVARRTREIGIRMALGASDDRVVRLILRQGAVLLLLGFAVGFPLALAVSTGATRLLHGARVGDPLVYGAVLGSLAVVGLLAAWIPARRAASVQPALTLKAE